MSSGTDVCVCIGLQHQDSQLTPDRSKQALKMTYFGAVLCKYVLSEFHE